MRYIRRDGHFPRDCHVKTPVGPVTIKLYMADDLSTVNEIFARRDYGSGEGLQVAVDVGANIGVASVYFLTRNGTSRVYCIEPDPKNIRRLGDALAPYQGRWSLEEVAADTQDGAATFFIEPTGRYGGFTQDWKSDSITVPTRSFTSLVDEVLAKEDRIDVLKIDVEGLEEKLVGVLRPDQLDRISTIFYETVRPQPLHTDRYDHHFGNQVNALTQRHG